MAEQQQRQLNPLLALAALYKKDGKTFDDVTKDILNNINGLGFQLEEKYVKDKILPWVYSFVFMTTAESLLREYIQNLLKTGSRPAPEGKMPVPPPAEIP